MKKKLLIIAGSVVVLILAAALVLPLLIDADGYRPDLESAMAAATGRSIGLGELSFSLLPAPSLRAQGITIGEDPAFGREPFLEASDLSIAVAVLPLLGGRLELGAVTIDSPTVRVHRLPEGWSVAGLLAGPGPAGNPPEGLSGTAGGEGSPDVGEGAAPPAPSSPPIAIHEVRLAAGTLLLVDGSREEAPPLQLRAEGIEASLSGLSATSPVTVDLSFSLEGGGGVSVEGRFGPMEMAGGGSGWPVDARVRVESLDAAQAAPWLEAFAGIVVHAGALDLDLQVGGRPPGTISLDGTLDLLAVELDPLVGAGAPIRLDAALALAGEVAGDSARLSRGDLSVGHTKISVTGGVSGLVGEPRLDLKLEADATPVAGVLPVLGLMGVAPPGIGLPGTVGLDAGLTGPIGSLAFQGRAILAGLELRDPSLTEPLREISGTAIMEPGGVAIEGFKASLGGSRLEGGCRIEGFDSPVITLDLDAPILDVDELLSLLAPVRAARVPASRDHEVVLVRQVAEAPPADRSGRGASPLSRIIVKGTVAATQAKLMNLSLTEFRAGVEMTNGLVKIGDARLELYGGLFQGEITADLGSPGPPFTLDAELKGVDFNGLATDFSPEMAGLLFGTLDADLVVQGRGVAGEEIREALTGEASFSLADGKLTSVGVLKKLASALESAGGRGIGEEETPFSYLGGTFRIRNGKVKTSDLKLDSPEITMRGEGKVMMDLGLDLDLKARISPEVTADMIRHKENLRFLKDRKERIRLDLRVGGTLLEPAVKVDPEMLRRILKNATREKVLEGGLKNLLKKKDP